MEPFRFINRARQRRLAQEHAGYDRMMQLLETVLQRAENSNKFQVDAVVALANSSQAHAETLAAWFKLFQANMGEGMSHTVRPGDEADAAEKLELDALAAKGYPVHGTPQEQMAWLHGG